MIGMLAVGWEDCFLGGEKGHGPAELLELGGDPAGEFVIASVVGVDMFCHEEGMAPDAIEDEGEEGCSLLSGEVAGWSIVVAAEEPGSSQSQNQHGTLVIMDPLHHDAQAGDGVGSGFVVDEVVSAEAQKDEAGLVDEDIAFDALECVGGGIAGNSGIEDGALDDLGELGREGQVGFSASALGEGIAEGNPWAWVIGLEGPMAEGVIMEVGRALGAIDPAQAGIGFQSEHERDPDGGGLKKTIFAALDGGRKIEGLGRGRGAVIQKALLFCGGGGVGKIQRFASLTKLGEFSKQASCDGGLWGQRNLFNPGGVGWFFGFDDPSFIGAGAESCVGFVDRVGEYQIKTFSAGFFHGQSNGIAIVGGKAKEQLAFLSVGMGHGSNIGGSDQFEVKDGIGLNRGFMVFGTAGMEGGPVGDGGGKGDYGGPREVVEDGVCHGFGIGHGVDFDGMVGEGDGGWSHDEGDLGAGADCSLGETNGHFSSAGIGKHTNRIKELMGRSAGDEKVFLTEIRESALGIDEILKGFENIFDGGEASFAEIATGGVAVNGSDEVKSLIFEETDMGL
jgi:hypothetical protein